MLDTAWDLFRKYFNKAELGIKQEIVEEFGGYENLWFMIAWFMING